MYLNIKVDNKIYQIDPHNYDLKDMIKLQKKIIEQHGIDVFLKCCYCSIIGRPE